MCGCTTGYGLFHLPDEIFARLRKLIAQDQHAYADGYQFGDGPNWRLRVARVGLQRLDLDPDLVRHGIKREIYAMPLMGNFRDALNGIASPDGAERASVERIASAALERWVLPRAETRPSYKDIRKADYLAEHIQQVAT